MKIGPASLVQFSKFKVLQKAGTGKSGIPEKSHGWYFCSVLGTGRVNNKISLSVGVVVMNLVDAWRERDEDDACNEHELEMI